MSDLIPPPAKDHGPLTTDILSACPVCGSQDLFIRKDFPQKLGLALVVLAGLGFLILAANPRTFYLGVLILLGATAVDAVLYFVVRKITVCYRCGAEFRNNKLNPKHGGFELAVAEKYRKV